MIHQNFLELETLTYQVLLRKVSNYFPPHHVNQQKPMQFYTKLNENIIRKYSFATSEAKTTFREIAC